MGDVQVTRKADQHVGIGLGQLNLLADQHDHLAPRQDLSCTLPDF
ncbi:hypothetical protein [Lichenifustis flavocetrariae]|nr:hypothetical protein [Lichenifustis flavocetrariae]